MRQHRKSPLRFLRGFLLALCFFATPFALGGLPRAAAAEWQAEILPVELTVGYAVRCVDLSGDGLLDIAIVDAKRILWLEAPTWTPHVIFETPQGKADNVCFAPHDIDGDGRIDFAIGFDWQPNNTQGAGEVGWLRSPANPRDPWNYLPIASPFPTVHRMVWLDSDGDSNLELVVAPLKGRNSSAPGFEDKGVELTQFQPSRSSSASPASGVSPTVSWKSTLVDNSLHVMHNLHPFNPRTSDKKQDLLLASFEGVHWLTQLPDQKPQLTRLGSGLDGVAPAKGSSEVRLGHSQGGKSFIATIEPWHGHQVVVYESPEEFQWLQNDSREFGGTQKLWDRQVIDDQLKWGHAVACANLDDDPEDEIVIGVRDDQTPHRCGVRIYDRDSTGTWKRHLVEPGQVAVEDLVVADLDNDGRIEIIAVGRATKNAVIYRQIAK